MKRIDGVVDVRAYAARSPRLTSSTTNEQLHLAGRGVPGASVTLARICSPTPGRSPSPLVFAASDITGASDSATVTSVVRYETGRDVSGSLTATVMRNTEPTGSRV